MLIVIVLYKKTCNKNKYSELMNKSLSITNEIRAFLLKHLYHLRVGLRQWMLLNQRYWTLKITDTWYLYILLLQAPFIALIFDLVFLKVKDFMGPLMFGIAISALWFGLFASIREIVSESAVYHRERMINLRIVPYVFSKIPFLLVASIIQCVILLLMVYPVVVWDNSLSFQKNTLNMVLTFVILVITAFCGIALGLMLSTFAMLLGKKTISRTQVVSSEVAMSLIPLALLPQIILGGPFIIYDHAYIVAKILTKVVPVRWSLSAFLNLYPTKAYALLKNLGMDGENIFTSCGVLIAFTLSFLIATILSLKIHNNLPGLRHIYRVGQTDYSVFPP